MLIRWSYTHIFKFFAFNSRADVSLYYSRVQKCDQENTLLYMCVAMVTVVITP